MRMHTPSGANESNRWTLNHSQLGYLYRRGNDAIVRLVPFIAANLSLAVS